jgi:hypothetical protein
MLLAIFRSKEKYLPPEEVLSVSNHTLNMIRIATTFSNRYSRIDGFSLYTTMLEYKLEEEHIVLN